MSDGNEEDEFEAVDELFESSLKAVENETGNPFYTLDQVEKAFGVPGCLSTGQPSLDLLLMNKGDEYGVPYGRFTEIHGESQSFKTSLLLILCAQNIKRGGLSYFMKSEMDIDSEYARSFIKKLGVDEEKAEKRFAFKPVMDFQEIFENTKALLQPYKEIAEEIEERDMSPAQKLPDILLAGDSLASMHGGTNRERIGEGDNDKMGSHAKEIHDYYKYFLYDFARLGVANVFTNHYRADLGWGNRKRKPAHESAIKYYASLRISLNRAGKNETKRQNYKKHAVSFPINVGTYKKRGELTLDGETTLHFHHHHGLDYIDSLYKAVLMSNIVAEKKKYAYYNIDEIDKRSKFYNEYSDYLEEYQKTNEKEIKKKMKDDKKFTVLLEELVYKKGPEVVKDQRGGT